MRSRNRRSRRSRAAASAAGWRSRRAAICASAAQSSRFAIPAAKLGVGYGFAGLQRLVDLIGPAFAKEMLFTARLFSAAEAYEMGLVNRVVADGEVEAYVADYARTIAANAPLTVGAAKAIVGEVLKEPGERDLARCEELVRACFASRDYVEGREAFLEKRPPAVHRRLRPARRVRGVRAPAPPRSSAAPAPGTGAARP